MKTEIINMELSNKKKMVVGKHKNMKEKQLKKSMKIWNLNDDHNKEMQESRRKKWEKREKEAGEEEGGEEEGSNDIPFFSLPA